MSNTPGDKKVEISRRFWDFDDPAYCYQRMTTTEWRQILLEEKDTIIVRGRVRQLVAKSLGAGVVEIRMEPLGEEE